MNNNKDRFDDFWEQYIDDLMCDFDERPKTLEALKHLVERVPEDVLFDLPVSLTVFAPSALGMALKTVTGGAMIYLAPELEKSPQLEVDFIVAHEFAHVYLGDYGPIEAEKDVDFYHQKAEMTADELVASWGYSIPEYRKGNTER